MKLTAQQKIDILPYLREAVQAKIECWDAQRQIESVLGTDFDNMEEGLENLAINYPAGSFVKLSDVQNYIDGCGEER